MTPPDRWDRLAGRLVMAPPAGERLSARERRILAEGRVRHLILFGRNLRERTRVGRLVAEARSLVPGGKLLAAVDHEGGLVSFASRVAPAAPSPMLLAAIGSADLVAAWAECHATHLRAIGINMVNAPVLDVASPGGSDVIGTRSFGGDPDRVALFGAAAIGGLLRGGVIPVAKHFPGHGGVRGDSHVTLPRDGRPAGAIVRRDLPPFRAATAAGVPVVMVSHVAYPALDGGRSRPATLSPAILDDLLRKRLRFRGVVLSDAVEMKAFGGDAAAVDALAAGVDLFCRGDSLVGGARLAARLARALREGRVDRERAQSSAAAVASLLSIPGRRRPPVTTPPAKVESGFVRIGKGKYRPPEEGEWTLFLPRRLPGRIGVTFDTEKVRRLAGRNDAPGRIEWYPFDPNDSDINRLAAVALHRPVVLCALAGRGALPEGQVKLASALRSVGRRFIAVGLLDPEPVVRLAFGETILTFDCSVRAVTALVRMVERKKTPSGKLPLPRR